MSSEYIELYIFDCEISDPEILLPLTILSALDKIVTLLTVFWPWSQCLDHGTTPFWRSNTVLTFLIAYYVIVLFDCLLHLQTVNTYHSYCHLSPNSIGLVQI
jgi:hypothetical protein